MEFFKHVLYLLLFAAFLGFMVKSFQNLKSEKTGISIQSDKVPTKVPSFTLCPWPWIERMTLDGAGIAFDKVLNSLNIKNVTQLFMNVTKIQFNGMV